MLKIHALIIVKIFLCVYYENDPVANSCNDQLLELMNTLLG